MVRQENVENITGTKNLLQGSVTTCREEKRLQKSLVHSRNRPIGNNLCYPGVWNMLMERKINGTNCVHRKRLEYVSQIVKDAEGTLK